ncbi:MULTISPECIES: hypothetical protein [Fischerella]|uniref:hypothetical protein n=1 Tax=Fischerella TaxID=1190 RepID=UPI0007200D8E|nr:MULTISPECIES: hypothetical protein [Fischerella]BAU07475.1 hypothetical protein FIS3754_34040 [Fischerella sp. NIES-3754]BCX09806.1 MAG: hypothetical protein KatS3mg066_3665 [Fischerella sp.]
MKMKIWMWSTIVLLITNLVVVAIVAFLIYRDSVQPNQNRSLDEHKLVMLKT